MSEDTGFNIDFGALRSQAAEMLDKADQTPAPTEVAEAAPVQTDKVEAPAEQLTEQQDSIEQSAALALEDDALVKVVVDGEEREIPWKEAKSGISGGLKFTQKMQQLAREKQEFEAQKSQIPQLQSEINQLKAFLQSPQLLEYVQQVFGPQQQAPQGENFNPDELATLGDARSLIERQQQEFARNLQQLQQNVTQTIEAKTAELAFKQEVAKHAVTVQSTLEQIFSSKPVLKAIPNAEQLIRFEVAKMLTPESTEADAVEAFNVVANGMEQEISKHFKTNQTVQRIAEAKKKLETKTIEPAGGSAPQIAPTSFKAADGQVDWNKVRAAAAQYLNG